MTDASPSVAQRNSAAAQAALSRLERTLQSGELAHLPDWQGIDAADVEPGVGLLVAECAAAFTALERDLDGHGAMELSWGTLLEPMEHIEHRLGAVIGAISHLLSVKYSDALQQAYDAVRPEVVALSTRMSQSQPLYGALQQLQQSPEGQALDNTRARILSESLRGMERAGVHLTGTARDQYQANNRRLAELSTDFQTQLVQEEKQARVVVGDASELAGVPAAVQALAQQQAIDDGARDAAADDQAGPWHFVPNGPNYMAVLQHALNPGLRERMYRAFRERGTTEAHDNRPVLREILELRQQQAQLVGFANYAELSIDSKMAPSVAAVWALLDELETAARPVAEREYAELLARAEATELAPWDVAYQAERLREARYDYDAEALRDYFQLPRVLEGLFDLTARLYDVSVVESTDAEVPRWDPSVTFYEVHRAGKPIAGFYVDPYARPGEKRGGAWMNTVVGRSRLLATPGHSASLPVALFVMNARPPAAGRPGVMSLDEVRTLFHEFGHATQHMLTQVEEGGASGMNLVEWDSVELASQFNEYWMEHKPFLRALTAHVDSGEALDDATLDRIIEARNFMVGNGTLRQVLFAKVDMRLHEQVGIDASADPFAIERAQMDATLITPTLPEESQLPAFGHLFAGGYAAGYYSYKWAEVLAADAFGAFQDVGLDNPEAVREVAQRFADTVLGLGGSLPAAEVYRRFRGRDASAQALLESQGLVAA